MIMAANNPLLPLRVVAILALAILILGFFWLHRHLRQVEKTIVADDLVPAKGGPRNNAIFILCAFALVLTILLLFLIINT